MMNLKRPFTYFVLCMCASFPLLSFSAEAGPPSDDCVIEMSPLLAAQEAQTAQELRDAQGDWPAIKALYLPSLLAKDCQKKAEEETKADKDPHEALADAFSKISDEEKIKIAIGLHTKCANLRERECIADDATYRSLNIFCGEQGGVAHNFVERTNKTRTVSGLVAYLDLLYHPTTDIRTSVTRQQGIRELVENVPLYQELREKLAKLAQAESKLLACWHEQAQGATHSILRQFYVKDAIPGFGLTSAPFVPKATRESIKTKLDASNKWLSERLNQSGAYLESKKLFEYATRPLFDVAQIGTNLSREVCQIFLNKPMLMLQDSNIERVALKALFLAGIWFMPEDYQINAVRLLFGSMTAYWTAQRYKQMWKTEQATLELHKIMNEIATFMVTAQEVVDFVRAHQVLYDAVNTNMKPLQHESPEDVELDKCIRLLDQNYFKKEPRLIGLRGRVLAAYASFKEIKDSFIPHYVFIGNVDALFGIATLMKETNACTNNPYQYAQYIQDDRPHMVATQFWNPFIDANRIVANDIALDQSIILTGPNAGGKSTTLKAVALLALLAQALTITPGNVELTPFSKIITLLNIADVAGKLSGHQAHTDRVATMLEQLESTRPQEFSLIVPDELYNTTEQSCASALCYGIFEYIAQNFPNARFIAATHFPDLNALEKESHGRIRNYKVSEASIEHGEISWPYTIEPGVNTQSIALAIAEQEYGHRGDRQSAAIFRAAKERLSKKEQ